MRLSILAYILSGLFFSLASFSPAMACNPTTVQWTGDVDNDWNNTANFNTPPSNGDEIIIDPANYTGAAADPIVGSTSSFNPNAVYVQNGASLDIQGDLNFEEFWFTGGEFVIDGNSSAVNITNNATVDIQFFGNKRDITVQNNAQLVINNSVVLCRDFSNGGTATFNGGSIRLTRDFINNGSFNNPAGTTILEGSNAQDISGSATFANITLNNGSGASIVSGSFNLTGTLTLSNGTFNTNNSLTLLSNASGTARIAEITGGAISGDITMQRYINAGSTDWRFFSSPLSGRTLADWNDDFITSGFTGSDAPAFPFTSIYSYDETVAGAKENGFVPAGNISDPVNVGEGYWVWAGDTITGTQPFTIDVTGPVNTGNISLPVSYTASSGGAAEDGWSMVGNPYPSTIDWDAAGWTKTNMNNAIYIWDPDLQQYAAYVGGIGVNGGSNLIASSQAFWVQANATSPQLTASESVKSAVDQSYFKTSSSGQYLTLEIDGNGYKDETVITINDNATTSFDAYGDAEKFYTSNQQAPSIVSVMNNKDYSINSLPPSGQTIDIPVKALVQQTGNYQLNITGASGLNASCIVLEDSYTGNTYNIPGDSSSFNFTMDDSTTAARFVLHIAPPVIRSSTPVSCHGMADGAIMIGGNGSGPWNLNVTDINGNTISSSSSATAVDTITGLSAGTYIVNAGGNTYCNNISDTIVLADPAEVIAGISVQDSIYMSSQSSYVEVSFTNTSSNALSYFWDFGDNATTSAYQPSHSYQDTGSYLVTMIAGDGSSLANSTCTDTSSATVTVLKEEALDIEEEEEKGKLEISAKDNQLLVGLSIQKYRQVVITVNNVLGQTLIRDEAGKRNRLRKTYQLPENASVLMVNVYLDGKPHSRKVPVIK